jgi:hypothetical protein
MEIETEFALFSKKIKLNSLNPSANQEINAPPEVEEIVNLVIPRRDPRFASHRELLAFVAENEDEATNEDDMRVLKVHEAHDRILNEKRRCVRRRLQR